jgi:hypothetical protein
MEIINLTINAIKQIKGPEYFRNEKKFIAKFQSKLIQQLKGTDLFPRGTKLKFLKLKNNPDHRGFKMRRVLVLHIPNKKGSTQDSNENNFVVYAFCAGRGNVKFRNTNYTLFQMFENLNYKTGIIINVGNYPDSYIITSSYSFPDRTHELSIGHKDGLALIKHSFLNGKRPF